MKKILLLFLLASIASSCAKKAVVAPFAPTPESTEPAKAPVSESEKLRVMNEVVPSNNVNQPAPHHVQQNSIEGSMPNVAVPVAPKAQQESAALHIDRILDAAPVKAYVKKASFQKYQANPQGPKNWAPQLKIGLTLMAIGVVLAVFGLGFVGGLAALIGLCFTIVGLLVTY
jgi:hypothetical protein